MKLPVMQLLRSFRASYWFLPSLMVVGAIVLGALMVWLDSGPAAGLLEPIGWYQQSKPEGAREVLSSIAGSMITVAGVVFSITIVAISFAANQYGPRILTNFMSDRGNQITLGTFIATFVYSIVVLRTIYGGDSAFVPQLAVMVALLLALCSIVVLIYFIHHVTQSIHINTITSRIGRQLIRMIGKEFPACFGETPEHSERQEENFARQAEAKLGAQCKQIRSDTEGYLETIDDGSLLEIACKHDLIIRVEQAPGQFLYRGQAVAVAAPADRVDDDVARAIRSSWTIGSKRTPVQDVLFLVDELVEIAARALSTGINDPYTAITCTDWLTAAAADLAARRPPSPYRLDRNQDLRVIAPSSSFDLHIRRGFGRLRPYAAGDVNAGAHFLSSLNSLASECRSPEQVASLRREVDALLEEARSRHEGESLERLKTEAAAARAALAERLEHLSNAKAGGRRTASAATG